jgi:mono/diheme cytochrome c family protein
MACFAVLAVALGCGKNSSGSSANSGNGPNPTPNPSGGGSGAQIFAQLCSKCHATQAGKKGKAPNLAGIGSKPEKNVDWIEAHVKNPKTHNPRSRMPAFEGKISDADLKTLADYLKTLN